METTNGHGISLSGGSNFNRFTTIDINDTGGSGVRIDGSSQITFIIADQDRMDTDDIDNLVPNISNPGAHGVHLLGGANRCTLPNLVIKDAGGSGVFLETDVQENHFDTVVVKDATSHGIHLSGSTVRYNRFYGHKIGKLEGHGSGL